MIAILISLLLQLGILQSEAQWHQLNQQQQDELKKEIIITDDQLG